jgi:hypothetical protein
MASRRAAPALREQVGTSGNAEPAAANCVGIRKARGKAIGSNLTSYTSTIGWGGASEPNPRFHDPCRSKLDSATWHQAGIAERHSDPGPVPSDGPPLTGLRHSLSLA